MTLQERHGTRDLSYSKWHRPPNLPADISFLDIDWVEYCDKCKTPLAICELAQDIGQEHKPTTITRKLAEMAGIPAWLIFYKKAEDKFCLECGEAHLSDIISFRVKQVYPLLTEVVEISPDKWKERLIRLHREHVCKQMDF